MIHRSRRNVLTSLPGDQRRSPYTADRTPLTAKQAAQTYERHRRSDDQLAYLAAHEVLGRELRVHGPIRCDGWLYSWSYGASDITRAKARRKEKS